ncbi:MAG: 3-dehydro-L-gulonate 2-dehydrogenase [Firmicutes bacterium]|nr:3-dehydro-L-gulonate 2-dehydrogenase [Bacillota bacterium]
MRVPFETMISEFYRVLTKLGMPEDRARRSAQLFAESSRDGVYTHGLNRFPRYVDNIKDGTIDVNAQPVLTQQMGALARYDGCKGPGNLNAQYCMDRAMELAEQFGIGCVAVGNTNHWLRPGAFGLQAAEKGYLAIMWTNTIPNMPPWGGKDARLGNNPIVFAVPSRQGVVLLDVAMSMFSYGKLESYARAGKELPVDGGIDSQGNITKDAGEIMKTKQPLPIGYWKGSGMSLMLDLMAAVLSGGRTTREVGELPLETELCQVFIVMKMDAFGDKEILLDKIDATLADVKASPALQEGAMVRWPGEGMQKVRRESLEQGVLVDEEIWQKVLGM